MQRLWNLGNTTLRNPNRIADGLKLFSKEFQGRIRGEELESRFWNRLVEEGIVSSEGSEQSWGGRKWRSAFVKLGFATDKSYKVGTLKTTPKELSIQHPELGLQGLEYEITPAGRNLLAANNLIGAIQDVYLRQLVRHEIPSPVESNFPPGRLKPFIFLLQVLARLKELDQPSINKLEIGIFLQLFRDHTEDLANITVERILEYRRERELQISKTLKKQLDIRYLTQASGDGHVKKESPKDYADTTIRYSQMSGIVTTQGARLILREDKAEIINAILESEPNFMVQEDPLGYLADFYQGTTLPIDNLQFARREIQRLKTSIRSYQETPQIADENIAIYGDIQSLQRAKYTLIGQLSLLKEEKFAATQIQTDSIQDILNYLQALGSRRAENLEITDPPTYLEWAVWRSFLAIDSICNPIQSTRRFPLDDNLHPLSTAPGGGSDMIFEFDDYVLAVEVTLTSSNRQQVAEGEPVRRHIANLRTEYPNKEIYGLFIAPSIDNNTAETFRSGVWYRGENEEYVNIVPITLDRFRQIIGIMLKRRFSPIEFKGLLDKCLMTRNIRAPYWKNQIELETERWIAHLNA